MTVLQRGDSGQDVRELQEALVRAGLDLGVDGEFGRLTEAAVEDFQRGHGLEHACSSLPAAHARFGLRAARERPATTATHRRAAANDSKSPGVGREEI